MQDIAVSVSGNKIEFGSETIHQKSEDDEVIHYELPADVCDGPKLQSVSETVSSNSTIDYSTNKSTGNLQSFFEQKSNVFVEQRSPDSSGQSLVVYSVDFTFTNPTDSIEFIKNVTAEYKDASGEWLSVSECCLSRKDTPFYYQINRSGSTSFEIGLSPFNQAFTALIKTNGPFSKKQTRRTPVSLPQPMVLRFNVISKTGQSSSIEVSQENEPPTTVERIDREKYHKKSLAYWLTCDDTQTGDRNYVEVCLLSLLSFSPLFLLFLTF